MERECFDFAPVVEKDIAVLVDIFNYYVLNTTVTLKKETLGVKEMQDQLFFKSPLYRSYTIRDGGGVVGYCSIKPWNDPEACRQTAGVSVYLDKDHRGRGIGSIALQFLEERAREEQICNLICGMTSENYPGHSVARKNGYVRCAHFSKVGLKFSRTLDMQFYQKIFTLA